MSARHALPLLVVPVLACAAPSAPPPRAVTVPHVAAPIADEDRTDNPSPERIIADWSATDRATRARLLVEARRAAEWTAGCRARHGRLVLAFQKRMAQLDESAARIDRLADFYAAFVVFRAAFDDASWTQGLDLDPWERARFGGPVDAYGAMRFIAWERSRSPLLAAAAATRPLGRTSFAWGSGPPSEGSYCSHARDAGAPGLATFVVPPELRRMLRPPFDGPHADVPLTPESPFAPGPVPFFAEGIVQSVAPKAGVVVARLLHRYQVVEQRPPCHPAQCTTLDCGMGPVPMVCAEVTIEKQEFLDVAFPALPPGVTLEKGDALALQTEEDRATTHGTLHAVVIDWIDRGPTLTRVWALDHPK